MQQLHRSVFKPLHQVAQGSTEPTRSLRNSIARLVLTAFGVVIIRRSETKVKRTELKLNVRVGVILSRRKLQGARLPLSCQTELFFNKYKIDPKRLFYIHRMAGDNCLSNELNDLLLSKDITGFWHTWNAKMCHSGVSPVIDGVTDSSTIADKFAQMFKSNCLAPSNDYPCEGSVRDQFPISLNNGGLERLEIATVDHCIAIMKKGKAPGADGIETEHLIHAHPLLVMQLCILFNIMLQHAVVPNAFHHGIIVPVVKDRRGDATDINNYRAITLSPCISKLFELCIIELYGDKLVSCPATVRF
jgi:hypothetical protein